MHEILIIFLLFIFRSNTCGDDDDDDDDVIYPTRFENFKGSSTFSIRTVDSNSFQNV